MAATLLAPGVHRLRNCPQLVDTRTFGKVLEKLGAKVTFQKNECVIDTTGVNSVEAPYELVKTMRASIYVLGRCSRASAPRASRCPAAARGDRVRSTCT